MTKANFTQQDPRSRMANNIAHDKQVVAVDKPKRKPGRPKTKVEETKNINIAIPVSMLEKMEIAKVCYQNNITLYINTLIKNDIEANFNEYETISNSLNRFI